MSRFATFKYLQSIGDRGRHNAPALGLVASRLHSNPQRLHTLASGWLPLEIGFC
jgi:hypothetical protein